MTTAKRSQISRPSTQITTVSDEPMMRHHRQRHQHHRHRQPRGDDEVDDHVDAAAEIAGEHAHGGADHARDQHGREADQQRDLRAVEQAREVVAARVVGAQRMRPGGLGAGVPDRRDQLARQLLVVGIVGRDQRRQQRHQHDDAPGWCRRSAGPSGGRCAGAAARPATAPGSPRRVGACRLGAVPVSAIHATLSRGSRKALSRSASSVSST